MRGHWLIAFTFVRSNQFSVLFCISFSFLCPPRAYLFKTHLFCRPRVCFFSIRLALPKLNRVDHQPAVVCWRQCESLLVFLFSFPERTPIIIRTDSNSSSKSCTSLSSLISRYTRILNFCLEKFPFYFFHFSSVSHWAELPDCLFSFFFISLSFHFLVIQSFSSDTKGKKKIQGQPNTETIGDYMMNTKEDGRCHPSHVDPFDVQCKAFYVSVCLVLHCVGYSTERDVCTTNGGKEERRIEEKKEEYRIPYSPFHRDRTFTWLSFVVGKETKPFGPILSLQTTHASVAPLSLYSPLHFKITASNMKKMFDPSTQPILLI